VFIHDGEDSLGLTYSSRANLKANRPRRAPEVWPQACRPTRLWGNGSPLENVNSAPKAASLRMSPKSVVWEPRFFRHLPPSFRVAIGTYKRDTHGSQTRRWLITEFFRRVFLSQASHCSVALLSFPRSGNHLVRYLIEHGLGRPTLGDRDNEDLFWPRGLHDLPLFLRDSSIVLSTLRPAVVKAHKVGKAAAYPKIIFICRSPVEAILSHRRDLSDEEFEEVFRDDVKQFCEIIRHVEERPTSSVLRLHYDFVTQEPNGALNDLSSFLEVPIQNRIAAAEEAKNLLPRPARESSLSYGDSAPDRRRKVSAQLKALGIDLTSREWASPEK